MEMSEHILPKTMKEDPINIFRRATSKQEVAFALGFKYNYFLYLIYGNDIESHYTEFNIQKRNGKQRTIAAPDGRLKQLQKNLAAILVRIYKPKYCVKAFIPGSNIVYNASPHLRKKNILKIDLEDFFPSIHFGRVRNLFTAVFNFPIDISTMLARICCYKGALPQGAPTSPIVSNMICLRLDGQLSRLAKDNRCAYTRYADDITLSTNEDNFSKAILREQSPLLLSEKIIEVIEKNNFFKINRYKTRLMVKNDSKFITGVKVNEKINVSRRKYREVRAMLHAVQHFGPELALIEHLAKYDKRCTTSQRGDIFKIIDGKISFISMVRGEGYLAAKLKVKSAFLKESFGRKINYDNLDILQSSVINTNKYIIVITEGKTDRMYLSLALRILQKRGKFTDLNILFYILPKTAGCGVCKNDLAALNTKGLFLNCSLCKKIYIFDRDIDNQSRYFCKTEHGEIPKYWGNNTWSFILPIPYFRKNIDKAVSIEHFLIDDRLFSLDDDGRRLYFYGEFVQVGEQLVHQNDSSISIKKQKKEFYTIIDDKVMQNKKNIARSKYSLAVDVFDSDYIDDVSLQAFSEIFEMIERIAK